MSPARLAEHQIRMAQAGGSSTILPARAATARCAAGRSGEPGRSFIAAGDRAEGPAQVLRDALS